MSADVNEAVVCTVDALRGGRDLAPSEREIIADLLETLWDSHRELSQIKTISPGGVKNHSSSQPEGEG